jgi:choline dehydrogenase-like flavoprotein
VGLSGRGEQIPNEYTYLEIDPDVVDQWGIPVPRFHFAWTDHERKQAAHMHQTFQAILETMGGKIATPPPATNEGEGISIGGMIIHELGTVRMGSDPATSVLNKHCQAHEVKNLFVADAAARGKSFGQVGRSSDQALRCRRSGEHRCTVRG